MQHLAILGTRGIPASHGGFETFAEHLSLWLTERGWHVRVYCQEDGRGRIKRDYWRGIERLRIPVCQTGAFGTVVFDWISTRHAARSGIPVLTLGYNTAVFWSWLRIRGVSNVANMDGIEWARVKWRLHERIWLWINEKAGAKLANRLVADHPEIAHHLAALAPARKISMIPYGADCIEEADPKLLGQFGLSPKTYATVIARPEPENSVLEIVRTFSRKNRQLRLVVLGAFHPESNVYHRKVFDAASNEVIFPGAIYSKSIIQSLRFHCRLYIHGHTVGGTNPSLVEALGAGCPILARSNRFNRWVAGRGAAYFATEAECGLRLDELLDDEDRLMQMSKTARTRHAEHFTWKKILQEYERLLTPRENDIANASPS